MDVILLATNGAAEGAGVFEAVFLDLPHLETAPLDLDRIRAAARPAVVGRPALPVTVFVGVELLAEDEAVLILVIPDRLEVGHGLVTALGGTERLLLAEIARRIASGRVVAHPLPIPTLLAHGNP